jgi:hypothetical protein
LNPGNCNAPDVEVLNEPRERVFPLTTIVALTDVDFGKSFTLGATIFPTDPLTTGAEARFVDGLLTTAILSREIVLVEYSFTPVANTLLGIGAEVGVREKEALGVGVGVSVAVGVGVGVEVNEDVSVAVGVGVGVEVNEDVSVAVGVGVGVEVNEDVSVAVGVGVGVGVSVAVGVGVGVGEAVGVSVEVGVDTTGAISPPEIFELLEPPDCGAGMAVEVGANGVGTGFGYELALTTGAPPTMTVVHGDQLPALSWIRT